jgi:CheW-like domain
MRERRPPPRLGSHEGVILFSVGGFKFAIAAVAVKEIRSLEGLREFALGGISVKVDKLRYTLERGGATYFVVDAARHFSLPAASPGRILILNNSSTAVLVDSTDRMTDISVLHALPRAFIGDERTWYRGLAVVNGDVVPVVNPNAFLDKTEQEIVRQGLERLQGVATL